MSEDMKHKDVVLHIEEGFYERFMKYTYGRDIDLVIGDLMIQKVHQEEAEDREREAYAERMEKRLLALSYQYKGEASDKQKAFLKNLLDKEYEKDVSFIITDEEFNLDTVSKLDAVILINLLTGVEMEEAMDYRRDHLGCYAG